jgi:pimeloyl-ACP methyl ester carboxylesterase
MFTSVVTAVSATVMGSAAACRLLLQGLLHSSNRTTPTQLQHELGQQLTLRDGRKLGYLIAPVPAGKEHSKRFVLRIHGTPESRLSGAMPLEVLGQDDVDRSKAVDALGIRSIYIDRWGVGLSSPFSTGKLKDFADDMLELADQLKIEQFAVVGGSGGGPYVYACAAALPVQRLVCSQIHVPVAPNHPNRTLRMPWIVALQHIISRRFAWSGLTEEKWLTICQQIGAAPADVAAMARDSKKWVWFFRNSGLDYTRNGICAAHKEAHLLSRFPVDWDVPTNPSISPCTVYVGDADKNTPVACAEWYRLQNPAIQVRVYPGQGHFSLDTLPLFHSETLAHLDEHFSKRGL